MCSHDRSCPYMSYLYRVLIATHLTICSHDLQRYLKPCNLTIVSFNAIKQPCIVGRHLVETWSGFKRIMSKQTFCTLPHQNSHSPKLPSSLPSDHDVRFHHEACHKRATVLVIKSVRGYFYKLISLSSSFSSLSSLSAPPSS